MAGRHQRRHRATLRNAHEVGAFTSGRVHDGAQVVDGLFQRRRVHRGIREARASLVERDDAPEGREPRVEVDDRGLLPHDVEVRDEAGRNDEVGPPSGHRERDVQAAALGIVDFRRPAADIHGRTLRCVRHAKARRTSANCMNVQTYSRWSCRESKPMLYLGFCRPSCRFVPIRSSSVQLIACGFVLGP
jgi:hypothetical protein